MAGWQQVLRDAPPEPLTADQAASIRRAALAAAAAASREPRIRRAPAMVIGGALLTAVTGGLLVTRSQPDVAPATRVTSPVVRQLQFATPGGTRIIWQFDPEFSLRETLP
jgi:hypothetical protein